MLSRLWILLVFLLLAGCGEKPASQSEPVSELQVYTEDNVAAENGAEPAADSALGTEKPETASDAVIETVPETASDDTAEAEIPETGAAIAEEEQEEIDTETDLRDVFASGTQFRNKDRFEEHYQKHVIDQQEFGNITRDEYMRLAQELVDTPSDEVLSKQNGDGDTLYYDPGSNSFAVVSADGYLRTFFKPSAGQAYYDRQK